MSASPPWRDCIYDLFAYSFFFPNLDPPSEGVSSGYESMRCESSANIHSSDSSSEKGKSPRTRHDSNKSGNKKSVVIYDFSN